MKTDNVGKARSDRVWLRADECHLDDLKGLVERTTDPADYPFASEVASNVLIYDGDAVRAAAASPDTRKALLAEWVEAMTEGPGIVVFRGAFDDLAPVDAASNHFWAMIDEQRASNTGGGDHFAKPGANDRIWNALEKLCLRDPEVFAAYYGNEIIALVSEAWLGPGYQMTSQLNVVNPGGAAQSAHRDYHLGFQTPQVIERYPAHVHRLSPVLTLQGAVAHCDMPVETGPTLYLPYSQTFVPGYLATGRLEFRDVLRPAPRAAAARQGGCGLFQSCGLPCRRHQPLDGCAPDRQPAPGLLGLWPGDGERRPNPDERGALPRAQVHAGLRAPHAATGRQRRRGVRGGLFLPDQPRPRPADRRARAEDPAGAPAPGASGGLGPGGPRGGAGCADPAAT